MKYVLVFLLFSISTFSQEKNTDSILIPVQKDGKWGFTNYNLKFVIPPMYDDAYTFGNLKYKNEIIKVAKVNIGKERLCIKMDNTTVDCNAIREINESKSFTTVSKPETEAERKSAEKITLLKENFDKKYGKTYDKIETFYLDPLLFQVQKGEVSGIVDKDNKKIIDISYGFFMRTEMQDQLMIRAHEKDKVFFFNSAGKLILETWYGSFSAKSDGSVYMVTVGDKKQFKLFNFKTEKFLNDKYYDKIINPSFINGFVRIQRGNDIFYVDENGKEFLIK